MMYSFDIFDTLITRKTINPSGIFLLMQERIQSDDSFNKIPIFVKESFCDIRINAEKSARHFKERVEVTLDDIYHTFCMMSGLQQESCNILKELELETEKKCCVGINPNIGHLKELYNAGEHIILVSDMYLLERQIRNILLGVDSVFQNLPIYVSSEYGVSKASGKLYIEVKKKENISYDSWMHIGDNQHSDINIPRLLGIKARKVSGSDYFEWERKMADFPALDKNSAFQLSVGFTHSSIRNRSINIPELVGMSICGPILLAYIDWIVSMCKQLGITRLYFIARDGYILKIIFDKYVLGMGINIDSKYIYGSRDAWRVDDQEQRRIIKAYMDQEVDFSDDAYAFVDLQGTGKSIEYLSQICQRKMRVFYYDLVQKPANDNLQFFTYTTVDNCYLIETLCRAPHASTTGYEYVNDNWQPIMEGSGLDVWNKSFLSEYLKGIETYTDYILKAVVDLGLTLNLRSIGDFLLYYLSNNPSKQVAAFIGNIVHADDNKSEYCYAPELKIEDVDSYLEEPDSYGGYNFMYSLKRSEDSVLEYYRKKTDYKWNENKQNNNLPYSANDKKIIIYGAGKYGQKMYAKYVNENKIRIVAWVDAAYESCQQKGMSVISLQEARQQEFDYLVITIAGDVSGVSALLKEVGIEESKILTVDKLSNKIDEWNNE